MEINRSAPDECEHMRTLVGVVRFGRSRRVWCICANCRRALGHKDLDRRPLARLFAAEIQDLSGGVL